ncbi:hypothetical protein A2U01_0070007 [Trifolium medium]|uniref:Uncharacterized protein n=1 Tax=Trifolium medium TaxID=97028 RepID=A0A392SKM9_9FABA|nr:hypothetical protein [Trifolium medium]
MKEVSSTAENQSDPVPEPEHQSEHNPLKTEHEESEAEVEENDMEEGDEEQEDEEEGGEDGNEDEIRKRMTLTNRHHLIRRRQLGSNHIGKGLQ